jgi:uncharacterized protein
MESSVQPAELTPVLPDVVAAPPPEPAWPAPPSERLPALDLLRGVAILGILPANIPLFAGVVEFNGVFGARNPETGADLAIELLTQFFVDVKMITLLSLLFGAGLAIQADRAWSAGKRFTGKYLRRMLVLFAIGTAHGMLLWFGDILAIYALVGVAAVLFVRLRPRRLLAAALTFLVLTWLLLVVMAFFAARYTPDTPPEPSAPKVATDFGTLRGIFADPSLDTEERWKKAGQWFEGYYSDANQKRIYREGPYWEQVVSRSMVFWSTFVIVFFFGGQVLACFLFGSWLLRRGLFSDLEGTRPLRTVLMLIGLTIGVPLQVLAVLMTVAGGKIAALEFAVQSIGAPLISLLYLGLLLAWLESGRARWLQRGLRDVGRIALTNYLMQSVICTAVFYSFGGGLYGTTGRPFTLLVVAAVWALELAWSPLYLRYFQIGPVEWLWRSLAEGKRRPLLRAAGVSG